MKRRALTELIRAAEPTTAPSTWPLTELDAVNSRLLLRGTWVFAKPLDPARLKSSFARLLAAYPHLGGRMARGRTIERLGSGVPFTTAAAPDVYLDDVLENPAEHADRFADKPNVARLRRGAATSRCTPPSRLT
jgi:hypothetical protein